MYLLKGKNLERIFTFSENYDPKIPFTGKGVAAYSNGDNYNGEFVDGVSIYHYLHCFITLEFRKDMEKVYTHSHRNALKRSK